MAGLAGMLFLTWATLFAPVEGLQNVFADTLFSQRQGSANVTIVAIDDDALNRHGRLGDWPRTLHAGAIERLREAGARVIAYDLLLADEGQDDQALAQAMAEAGNVILPVAGTNPMSGQEGPFQVYDNFTVPSDLLGDAAAALGHSNVIDDRDGRVRRIPLAVTAVDGTQYLALSLAAVYLQFGRSPPDELQTDGDGLPLFGRTVPLEDFRSLRINYVGGENRFPRIAFDDLIEGRFDQSLVRNRIVLVGSTATGVDVHPVPIGRVSGVEIQANALDTILRAQFLYPTSKITNLVVGLALVAITSVAIPRWRIMHGVGFALALGAAWLIIAVFLFFSRGYIFDFIQAPSALLVAMIVALAYRTLAERSAQVEVTELFGRYVSHELAQELLKRADRSELKLGGELREVTTMFCDIRGFTPLSQRVMPAEMVQLLNRHFEVIVSNVLKNGGIVHQYLGDSVMAFWSAPNDQPDHAILACQAAMDAQAELERLRESNIAIKFGWGINTGVVLAGNVGTAGRMEYTVVGEAVNTASRLCSAAEGGQIWVGERTYESIQGRLDVDQLPPQHLKGMAEPINVYRLRRQISMPEARREDPDSQSGQPRGPLFGTESDGSRRSPPDV